MTPGLFRWVVPLVAILLLAACGGDAAPDDGSSERTVVVTHSLLGDVVSNVVGQEAHVEVIMPAGSDPHEFEPSAADIATLSSADLVIANGLGFEVGLADVLGTVADDGVPVVSLGEHLDPLLLEAEPGTGTPGEQHVAGAEDPHWFTDPSRMADAVPLIEAAVARYVPGIHDGALAEQADEYERLVRDADQSIEELLQTVPPDHRKLVTNHEVFGYFADRYGFEVLGTVIPSGTTLAEPSSGELADLAGVIEGAGVPAIFADTSSSSELADALAAEIGTPVAVVDLFSESLGPPGSGGATYLQMITTNAQRIADALA